MACVNCKRIRDAILHGRMAEAAGITVEALREKIGWKDEVESEPESAIPNMGVAGDEPVEPLKRGRSAA